MSENPETVEQDGPGPEELLETGDIDHLVPGGQYYELMTLMHDLKARREKLGLSLTDVSERSGLTRPVISKLENLRTTNPTLETLFCYALAVDSHIRLIQEDLTEDGQFQDE